MPSQPNLNFLALDVGDKRIGVALADAQARIAQPLTAISVDDHLFDRIQQLIADQQIGTLVIGLPRGLEGQHTAQTQSAKNFMAKLRQYVDIPIYWQDEAVTSRQAEAELKTRQKTYSPADIDALAATYILEDFLRNKQ